MQTGHALCMQTMQEAITFTTGNICRCFKKIGWAKRTSRQFCIQARVFRHIWEGLCGQVLPEQQRAASPGTELKVYAKVHWELINTEAKTAEESQESKLQEVRSWVQLVTGRPQHCQRLPPCQGFHSLVSNLGALLTPMPPHEDL